MRTLTVAPPSGPEYRIEVGRDLLATQPAVWEEVLGGRPLLTVVTDENVGPLHADMLGNALAGYGFNVRTVTLPAGEEHKTLDTVSGIWDGLIEAAADRKSVLVAVGGGVVGDMTGFAAACHLRGIRFIQAPTTLLAMVDAAVGGKTGVDHPLGKNLIGAFHQPVHVVCDIDTLATLPERDYVSGLAEVVKYGVICDADFFRTLETRAEALKDRDPDVLTEVVVHCCRLKAQVVAEDERETTGRRAILNYGHTFAHAFEAADYTLLTHGEAVAVGMTCASRLAVTLGRVDESLYRRQTDLLSRFGLPTQVPERLAAADLLPAMRRDKKSQAGVLRLILPTRLGHVETVAGIDEDAVRTCIGRCVS